MGISEDLMPDASGDFVEAVTNFRGRVKSAGFWVGSVESL
jgi:hypothetical protein